MAIIIPLMPRAKADADRNLEEFVLYCRNKLTGFGADLDFDSDKWDVTEFYSKKGHKNSKDGTVTIHFTQRIKDGEAPFCSQIAGFARAYMRSEMSNRNSSGIAKLTLAFRVLDLAIQELDVAALSDCDASVFNRASSILKDSASTDDTGAGSRLGTIARFLDEKGMVYAPLHNWKYIPARQNDTGRIGEAFDRKREKNLPPQRALDALAEAFHLAVEPRDVLITSLSAILCSAPERINEVMVLAENCEIEQSSSDGKKYLGLRWAGSKGAADHIKWVLPGMADAVRTALRRIRKIAAPARDMALWYEKYPTSLYLPVELEHLREKEILTLDEVGMVLNLAPGKRRARAWLKTKPIDLTFIPLDHPIKGRIAIQALRFVELEKYITSGLPTGFPIFDESRDLKYSEALLIMPAGLFGNGSSGEGSRCMFEVVRYHHIGCALGQNRSAGSKSVFQRVGLDDEGDLGMRTHQFRHWLNTLAQGANLSQVDIAKWSGRVTVQQNAAYDHVSSFEIVSKMREALGDSAKAVGALAEIPKNLPVTRSEFAAMVIPSAHVTLYGFCVHDFTALPCEMFRQCLDCREHICIKGAREKTARIAATLSASKAILVKAQQAVVDGLYGAEEWVATHNATVARLEQLLIILDDADIADGAMVQLQASGTYCLSEGALRDRTAISRKSTDSIAGSNLLQLPLKGEP